MSEAVRTIGGVPDVGVEGLSQRVHEAHQCRHGGEEENSGHGADALQHRVDPHTCHLVHPVGPAGGGAKRQWVGPIEPELDRGKVVKLKTKIKPFSRGRTAEPVEEVM